MTLAHSNGNCKPIAYALKKYFDTGQILLLDDFMRKYHIDLLGHTVGDMFNPRGHMLYVKDDEIYDPVLFARLNIPTVKTQISKYVKLLKEWNYGLERKIKNNKKRYNA